MIPLFRPSLMIRALAATAALSTTLIVAAPAGAAADTDAPLHATVPTNRPDIHAFAKPESGFNAETASTADLKKHGLPRRPSATAKPQALRQWQDVIRHAKHAITPQFSPRPQARRAPQFTRGSGTSNNWSGAVDSQPVCARRFFCPITPAPAVTGVEGIWTIPSVEGSGQVGTVSTWVGLDGFSNNQVQQIGTDATNTDFGFAMYEPWYELYPDGSQTIPNLPIGPGDQMYGMVQYEAGNQIWFFMEDLTTGDYSSFVVPATYSSLGQSAEWIMERPEYNGTFDHPLPYFGSQMLSDLYFWNDNGNFYPALASFPYTLTLLDMYGFSGDQLDHTDPNPDGTSASSTITWLNYQ
ncbi:MAG TPA: G1 family glutamic endopeptidase [Chloroflexota bacterium]|nr:G1 family glutamic endopeptidase [Chloroflexota bacterium]